jgi:hypothetical protein
VGPHSLGPQAPQWAPQCVVARVCVFKMFLRQAVCVFGHRLDRLDTHI